MAGYSYKAQPYLDAIASGVFASRSVRDWLLAGTPQATSFAGSSALVDEQRSVRWRTKPTKQPFWANYWCGKDKKCLCRPEGSTALESDAIFFLRNGESHVLALHVEFKHPDEPFSFGQPEAYPMRAACFVKTHGQRGTINPHHHWATAIFCGPEAFGDVRLKHFQRIISHDEARRMLPDYPALA